MLNYIWAGMILIGIMVAAFTGRMEEVSSGILDSSKEAISLCILMLGVVGLWTGVMKIAEETGLVRQLTKLLMPVLRVLFPRIADRQEVMGYIATNMIANMLGLGWAATPTGLQAMKELRRIQEERERTVAEGSSVDRLEKREGNSERTQTARKVVKVAKGSVYSMEDKSWTEGADSASDEMCLFMVMNISSLQLIPINMIAYRSQYGSVHPGAILFPALIATAVSTLVGVGYGYLKCRRTK